MSNINKYKLLAERCLELAERAENGHQERAALQEIAWRFAKLAYKAYFSEQTLDKPTALSRLSNARGEPRLPRAVDWRHCVSLR